MPEWGLILLALGAFLVPLLFAGWLLSRGENKR
jgi:hypothetical protein